LSGLMALKLHEASADIPGCVTHAVLPSSAQMLAEDQPFADWVLRNLG
jgi:hypothetical protein